MSFQITGLKLSKEFTESLNIGVPEGSKDKNGISNVDKALLLEFGTENTPARPFLTIGKENIRTNKEFLNHFLNDKSTSGKIGVKEIQNVMDKFNFAPLKESTLASRRRRGNMSVQPTVDTASLKNSLGYEING